MKEQESSIKEKVASVLQIGGIIGGIVGLFNDGRLFAGGILAYITGEFLKTHKSS